MIFLVYPSTLIRENITASIGTCHQVKTDIVENIVVSVFMINQHSALQRVFCRSWNSSL